ncbi:MAG TPA: sulfotransferase [Gammaproteobacteria bacterium]
MSTSINPSIESLHRQATAAYASGHPELAEGLARRLIQLDESHADAYYLIGAIRLDAGNPASALPLLETAARLNPEHLGIQFAMGNAYFALGHWSDAVHCYDLLRQAGRTENNLLLNLGIALHKIRQNGVALEIFRRAIDIHPSDPALWNAYGDVLNKENDAVTSIMAHERAVALMPDNPDYVANLALMYETSNRMEDAERVATAMLKQHPQHELLLLICARCARRKKDFRQALALLERIPGNANLKFKRASLFEAGRLHDHLKETEQAYECFLEGNRLTLEVWPSHRAEAAKFPANWKTIHAYVTSRSSVNWPTFAAETMRPKHAFLLGFMRSGTTLMDTILETDSRITVLEEEQPIHMVIRAAEALPGGYPACLEHLTIRQVEDLRQLYWQEVTALTGDLLPDQIVLDKQPVLAPHLGLVKTLFPTANFIFALRHPCDVVLSSFMQPFGHNPFHANFVTLEQSASVYAMVMDLWLAYNTHFELKVHTLRYEELINNKQQALTEVFGFLGIEDADTDIDHVTHAKQRGRIYTPSYHQVVQPLYTDSMERWRRYRPYFEGVLPVLRPYAEQFGYTL